MTTLQLAANKPLYTIAANWGGGGTGKPAIVFDGSNDYLTSLLTGRLTGADVTIFAVISFTSLTAGSGARDMRIMSNESARYDGGWYIGTSTAGVGGGGTTCIKVTLGDFDKSYTSNPAVAINTPYLVSIVTGRQLFLNGIKASQGAASGVIPEIIARAARFTLGGDGGASQMFNGALAELRVYRGKLTGAQRFIVESYLAAKYGMAAPAAQATTA